MRRRACSNEEAERSLLHSMKRPLPMLWGSNQSSVDDTIGLSQLAAIFKRVVWLSALNLDEVRALRTLIIIKLVLRGY